MDMLGREAVQIIKRGRDEKSLKNSGLGYETTLRAASTLQERGGRAQGERDREMTSTNSLS